MKNLNLNVSPRNRRAIILGAAALAVILAARLVLIPWIDSWQQARQQIADAQGGLRDLDGQLRRLLAQRQRLEKIYGPGSAKPLADVQAAKSALVGVKDILKAGGFNPTSFRPQPPRSLRTLREVELVPLQVRGKCKLPQLVNSLAGLRKSQTLFFVDRLTITNDQKKPGELDVVMVLATLARQAGRR